MKPGKKNLDIYRGDIYGKSFRIRRNGEYLSFTGTTILAQIRASQDSAVVLASFVTSVSTEVMDGENVDTIHLALSDEITATLPNGFWDLQVTDEDGPVTYLAGLVKVHKDVSRG